MLKTRKKIRLELKLNLKDNHLTGKNNIFIYHKTIRLYLPFASSSFKFSNLLLHLIFGFILSAQPTIKEILDSPFASNLVVSRDGNTLAWVDNIGGERNIFVATGEQFSSVYQLTKYVGDQGISLSNLKFTADDKKLIYVRGNKKNEVGEPANPALLQEDTNEAIFIQSLNKDDKIKISNGSQPNISHDGFTIAFLNEDQIWTVSLSDSIYQPKQLFEIRGSQFDINWSPNDDYLAFTSRRADNSYIGIYSFNDKKVVFMDPSFDHDFSPEWSPNSKKVAFIRRPYAKDLPPFSPQRSAHPWSIRVLDINNGRSSSLWTADIGMGSVFFDQFPQTALKWTNDNQLIFPWEKNGWMHLYSLDIQTGNMSQLTYGDGIVEQYQINKDENYILFTTNINDIHRRHIGKIDLDLKKSVMLTSGEGSEFSPLFTKRGLVFLKTTAQHTSRPAIFSKGKTHLIGDRTKIFKNQRIPDVIKLTATDGNKFMATILYPDDYDKRKKYPASIFLHGGSRRQMLQSYHYSGYYSNAFALQQYFASQGYIAMMINYRSGIGYGTEFREANNYGIAGASEVYDLIGAGEYLASRSDIDPKRISIWGGSYGGYLTAHGLSRRSDLFSVGVDIHGVHNWNTELPTFASWYNPNYYPKIAEMAYKSSPEAYIDGWKSPVLLIHGDDDRNVPFSESVVLSEQLRDRGIYFEQLIFPDEVHGFLLHDSWVKCLEATFEFINRHIGTK